MSAVGGDFNNILARPTNSFTITQIANILTILNKRTTPIDEDAALIKHIAFAEQIVLVDDTDSAIALGLDIDETDNVLGFDGLGYTKFIPDVVRVYQLTHNNSNAGGITFPSVGNVIGDNPTIGRKYMGAGKTDGNSYMIINDNSWFNNTDSILLHCWAYLPANSGADQYLIDKGTQFRLKTGATNVLTFNVTLGGSLRTFTYTYTPNTWIHIIAQAKSTSQQLIINGVTQSSGSFSGTITTNSTNVGIFGSSSGTNKLASGGALAWISMAHGFGDSTWISNAYGGLIDFDTDVAGTPNEITTIPLLGSLRETPNSFVGDFMVS